MDGTGWTEIICRSSVNCNSLNSLPFYHIINYSIKNFPIYTNTVIMASQRENTRIQIQALNKSKLSVKEIVSVLRINLL